MEIDQALIGKSSDPQTFEVTEEAVQRFMQATEDPALHDDSPLLYAPPTFPTTFRVRIPDYAIDMSKVQVLHGEQEYRYTRRLRIGEQITCVARITNVRQRAGRSGSMTFIVTETTGTDSQQQVVFVARSTGIIRTKEG